MMMGWGVQEHHDLHDDQHQQDQGWRKGPWTPEEDKILTEYVALHGEGRWSSVAKCAGLNRSGKSCRLRWVNYLRPGLKRGQITPQEEGIIIELHALWGNKWSTIARYLPGRTDNEIKNYWRTHFKKKDRSLSKQDKNKRSSQNRKKQKHKQEPQPQLQPQIHEQDDMKIINHDDQDTAFSMNPTSTAATRAAAAIVELEEQYHMPHDTVAQCCSSDQFMVDEAYNLWGSLWNLDDDSHGCVDGDPVDQSSGVKGDKANNVDVQSIQGFPFCGPGDCSGSEFYMGDPMF